MPRPHPRKQLLLKLGVFLLLGAIVNVAVAWACFMTIDALEGKRKTTSDYRWPPPPIWTETTVWRKPGGEFLEHIRGTYHGRWLEGENPPPTRKTTIVRDRVGFPFTALENLFNNRTEFANNHSLPLTPVWLGFALNSVFYAMFLRIITLIPELRAVSRNKRHRCPACGYKIAEGVGPRCSECGHQLRSTGPA